MQHTPQVAAVADAQASTAVVTLPMDNQQHQTASDGDDSNESTDATPGTEASTGTTRPDASLQAFTVPTVDRAPQADAVRPAHVVGQIAHQAEFIRLPGGRGVRIQLHPEDLGGVGVTVKYGVDGSLELHVTAEHAATAELVQAGWNDLRDALNLQGIAPERLIMSVSGPGDASFSDSGSFRSDTGQASFSQGGQQPEHQSSRRGRADSGAPALEDTRDTRDNRAASTSRIDYRA